MKITFEANSPKSATVTLVYKGKTYTKTWQPNERGYGATGKGISVQLEEEYEDMDNSEDLDEVGLEELLELVSSPSADGILDFLDNNFYDRDGKA